ncbi:MAG: hypothetical protein KUA35_11615 [Pseudodesulfovibrio sp.]|uniref:Uncharacterized protein n=1 Tax=Pseudodesulfovibrio aespoeensis (strain ATCC 700646 / DSM 10631 / Aspo-2) TaxID=643562 RepID=E6VV07_PSEA9|nr:MULTISPECIES: hypothetical protein [Pseudodesulfovibrio]MBU4191446.1 hypothetical protein [Pseudomonadota bacterium]ADU63515.1 hypothetical protein Daes_2512 [Pseudodesulfovibrio aespoeensis Aspo-2]MBU4244878.1 hypothetical protein [Pseudomonadota bacterium]MBU4380083.1 hypothetical protein [Pseudomonadota bacterium]MBU4475753.1 hypothetical protein [Pseudomonadota bacterium]
MKISVAGLLLVLMAAPVLAAPLSASQAASQAAPNAQGAVLVAFSGQENRGEQADTARQDDRTDQNGADQGDPSGRGDRVVIKGKGGKVTGVERKPAPGNERDTGAPPRQ